MQVNTLSRLSLIVLGKGLTGDPKKGEKVDLTIHSKLNTLAAGLLYDPHEFDKVIFTGGRTKGNEYISEAEAMKRYLLSSFPDIPEDVVMVEPDSIDTRGNIIEMCKLGFIKSGGIAIVLSVAQHLRRARNLFWNTSHISAKTIASQEVIKLFGTPEHKKLLDKFDHSTAPIMETAKEIILNLLMLVDPTGKWLRIITKRTRG